MTDNDVYIVGSPNPNGRGRTPGGWIPRPLAEKLWTVYSRHFGGGGQDLDTVIRRGGFSTGECDLFARHEAYDGPPWREQFRPRHEEKPQS